MILFLDSISSLPEFSIIKDNKIIYSEKITIGNENKMSDSIIPVYFSLEKKILSKGKLSLFITNTGPGSYTSLRIGIAFLSGLSLAKNIELVGISCIDLISFAIRNSNLSSVAIFISSSNNQKFMCFYDKIYKEFKIEKIEKNQIFDNQKIDYVKQIFTNDKKELLNQNIRKKFEIKEINFNELVNSNIKKILKLPKKEIIKPIYVSNNKILNT
ncbi:tRNA (adenosine(37)-N6)-threonylcarbamoyltransferase complex dimerization subunit type 1 TsaB [Alphaproteobacteria bacterium]|nr:tRNA (adenosine(37)-N6)-threonylcarbamoyltransferase complex dimerization subunit type 1 TsaB [Alphaproteobacteria bacterium]